MKIHAGANLLKSKNQKVTDKRRASVKLQVQQGQIHQSKLARVKKIFAPLLMELQVQNLLQVPQIVMAPSGEEVGEEISLDLAEQALPVRPDPVPD